MKKTFGRGFVKAVIPGDVPAVPQRRPELVLFWADGLTEQPQGLHCQQRRDHSGRQVHRILWHHLWKERWKWVQTVGVGVKKWVRVKLRRAHHAQTAEKDVDKVSSGGVGQDPVQLGLSYENALQSHSTIFTSVNPNESLINSFKLIYSPGDWSHIWSSEDRRHIPPEVAVC